MDPLHVVTAIANPIRWQSRTRLYRQFEEHMLDSGVHLTVVECAYGDCPHEFADNPHITHVPVRARSLLWTKENLLNIGLGRLPQDWRHAAWIDADITFRRCDWASETVHALQQYDVVQPWSDCYDLGPNDEHLQVHRSFCRLAHEGAPIASNNYTFAHPGYAWAATRRALTLLGGLIETASAGRRGPPHGAGTARPGEQKRAGRHRRRLPAPAAALAGPCQPPPRRQHRLRVRQHRARLAWRQAEARLWRSVGDPHTQRLRSGGGPHPQHLGCAGAGRQQAATAPRHRPLFPRPR